MAAPILRYSDPRLFGTCIVKPCASSYEWTRNAINPIHPNSNLVVEVAFRALKAFTGTLAIAITALPALVGRVIQMIHYNSLSPSIRENPPTVAINNMQLPTLKGCKISDLTSYHGTTETAAISILWSGFNPSKVAVGSKLGEATYVSAKDTVSAEYGQDQLILKLDLREREIAYLSDKDLEAQNWNFSDKKVMSTVRELFLANGFKAIKYDLDFYGEEEAYAIYDTSCISISRVQPSPKGTPPEALLA